MPRQFRNQFQFSLLHSHVRCTIRALIRSRFRGVRESSSGSRKQNPTHSLTHEARWIKITKQNQQQRRKKKECQMQPYSICRYQFFTIYTFIDLQKVHYEIRRRSRREEKCAKKSINNTTTTTTATTNNIGKNSPCEGS